MVKFMNFKSQCYDYGSMTDNVSLEVDCPAEKINEPLGGERRAARKFKVLPLTGTSCSNPP